MTLYEVCEWCVKKTYEKARHEFTDRGNYQIHKVKFEDGDTYEHSEEYINSNIKRVRVSINGREEYDGVYEYEDFRWKEVISAVTI